MSRLSFLISTKPVLGATATVFATGARSPFEVIEEVEAGLMRSGVTGKVLFDLLLAHGNKINRYVFAYFDGTCFTPDPVQSAQSDYSSLSPLSAEFLVGHLKQVDSSLLPRSLRFALRQGIPV